MADPSKRQIRGKAAEEEEEQQKKGKTCRRFTRHPDWKVRSPFTAWSISTGGLRRDRATLPFEPKFVPGVM